MLTPIEEAKSVISALVDHVDAQLMVALAFFVGLRPGEIQGLLWEVFDVPDCSGIRCDRPAGRTAKGRNPKSLSGTVAVGETATSIVLIS